MESSQLLLKYLGLPSEYAPNPTHDPIGFANKHLRELPPNMARLLSSSTTPKQRTQIPTIRNRRLRYTESSPAELSFNQAKSTWPTLWQGREVRGKDEGKDEQDWADNEFLGGSKKHVGKLGTLLGGYEEEREAEKVRNMRRREAEIAESLPEEEEDTTDEDEPPPQNFEDESPKDAQIWFVRLIKERFIYGLLDVSLRHLFSPCTRRSWIIRSVSL